MADVTPGIQTLRDLADALEHELPLVKENREILKAFTKAYESNDADGMRSAYERAVAVERSIKEF